jgi:hypothetical protein
MHLIKRFEEIKEEFRKEQKSKSLFYHNIPYNASVSF